MFPVSSNMADSFKNMDDFIPEREQVKTQKKCSAETIEKPKRNVVF